MKPPESFVPLTAAPAPTGQREFQVTVLNSHNHPDSHGKTFQSNHFQTLETTKPTALTVGGASEKKIGEPRVTVQRDGDRITHLRIQCSCGQVIDLACVYGPPPAAK